MLVVRINCLTIVCLKACSPFVLKHTTSMYIHTYLWMERMPLKRAHWELFSPKTWLFRLDPSLYWNYSIKPASLYFKLELRSLSKFLRKLLFVKTQKVAATSYYGIEDPFPDLISKLRHFGGGYKVPIVVCQEPLVVRMPYNAKKVATTRGKLRSVRNSIFVS